MTGEKLPSIIIGGAGFSVSPSGNPAARDRPEKDECAQDRVKVLGQQIDRADRSIARNGSVGWISSIVFLSFDL